MSNNETNFVDRRVREGTIADRRDAGTIAKKRWSRIHAMGYLRRPKDYYQWAERQFLLPVNHLRDC